MTTKLTSVIESVIKDIGEQPSNPFLDSLKGLTFEQFWAKIGNPTKNNKEIGILPYETTVVNALEIHKLLYVLKATGLGITELILRWLAWMMTKGDSLQGKTGFIVCGPREQLAITLIDRMKAFFPNEAFETDKLTIILNGSKLIAMPSHALSAMRGQEPWCIYLDESDWFGANQSIEARIVSERYVAKCNPYIIMTSTPQLPNGLMDIIAHEQPCAYHRIFLPYTVGLGNIFTQEEIDEARKSQGFEREYNLKFGLGLGNIVKAEDLERCIVEYDLKDHKHSNVTIGVDPAWSQTGDGSRFAFVSIALVDGYLRVFDSQEFKALSLEEGVSVARHKIAQYSPAVIFVDGANPGVVKSIAQMMGQYTAIESMSEWQLKQATVRPVSFMKDGRAMLSNVQKLLSRKLLQIHPSFTDLIQQLSSASVDESSKLDKSQNSWDSIDALFLACKQIEVSK